MEYLLPILAAFWRIYEFKDTCFSDTGLFYLNGHFLDWSLSKYYDAFLGAVLYNESLS